MTIEWPYLTEVLKLFNFGPHLINWVRAFYCNVSSCVINNGFASPFVQLSRGVRQGCPLSGLLFVLAIELLGNAIRKAKDIKGRRYADNTTVFVADIFSAQSFGSPKRQYMNLASTSHTNHCKSEVANVKNFYQKLDSIKQLLNMWRTRYFSLLGKIQIVIIIIIIYLPFCCTDTFYRKIK